MTGMHFMMKDEITGRTIGVPEEYLPIFKERQEKFRRGEIPQEEIDRARAAAKRIAELTGRE